MGMENENLSAGTPEQEQAALRNRLIAIDHLSGREWLRAFARAMSTPLAEEECRDAETEATEGSPARPPV